MFSSKLNMANLEVLDNMIEGYQLIDEQWNYVYVNNAVVQQAKLEMKEDWIGHSMMSRFPGIENTEMFQTLKTVMNDGKSRVIQNEFDFPDGSKGYFELRINKVPGGIFILSMDITGRIPN